MEHMGTNHSFYLLIRLWLNMLEPTMFEHWILGDLDPNCIPTLQDMSAQLCGQFWGSWKFQDDGVLIPMECMMSKLKHLKTDMVEVCRQKSVVDSIYSSSLHREQRKQPDNKWPYLQKKRTIQMKLVGFCCH